MLGVAQLLLWAQVGRTPSETVAPPPSPPLPLRSRRTRSPSPLSGLLLRLAVGGHVAALEGHVRSL